MEQQRDRLASFGKGFRGTAHELNNSGSAANVRQASCASPANEIQGRIHGIGKPRFTPRRKIRNRETRNVVCPTRRSSRDALTISDLEDQIDSLLAQSRQTDCGRWRQIWPQERQAEALNRLFANTRSRTLLEPALSEDAAVGGSRKPS